MSDPAEDPDDVVAAAVPAVPAGPPPGKLFAGALSTLLVMGYGAPALLGITGIGAALSPPLGIFLGLGSLVIALIITYRWVRGIGRAFGNGRARAVRAAEWLILGILPIWGLVYSHYFGEASCSSKSYLHIDRPFAEPEVFGLVAFHALTVFAYVTSIRRPGALRPLAETLLHATLLAGVVAHVVVAVHVARWIPIGFAAAPIFLPCISPLLTVALYGAELRARLRRRGQEADTPAPWKVADSFYRQGPVQHAIAPLPRIHRPALVRAVLLGTALLGCHSVINSLCLDSTTGGLDVFTRTCGHVLSSNNRSSSPL